jgi:hypothetical protein
VQPEGRSPPAAWIDALEKRKALGVKGTKGLTRAKALDKTILFDGNLDPQRLKFRSDE